MWHPDKNPAPEAKSEFQKIQSAYQYLMEGNEIEIESYKTMLFQFLRDNIPYGIDSDNLIYIIDIILKRLQKKTESWAMVIFEKMGLELFHKIYSVILSYKGILYLSDEFMIEVKYILDKKIEDAKWKKKGQNTTVIHPTINDLFDNNLYKLIRQEGVFLIPLWHDELIYNISGDEFIINCIPILPMGVTIDENNNIIVEVTWQISEIWDKKNLFIYVGDKTFYISKENLLLKNSQIVRLIGNGISRVNTKNVYDISERGDIIIHVNLVL